MEEHIKLKLVHKSKYYEIPCQFKNLPNVNKEIYSKLLFTPSHTYIVKSNVDDSIFQSFINYWVDEKEPKIQLENYYQYYLLSQEFNLMENLLELSKENWNTYEQNLYILSIPSKIDKSQIEQIVSEDLDEYLEKYGKELMNLSIQTLINIFNNEQRKLTKHNLAYELIVKYYEETKKDNIFVLLGTLNGHELNEFNFLESIMKKDERYEYIPQIKLSYFHDFSLKISNLEKVINNFYQVYEEQSQTIEELKNTIKQNQDTFSKELSKMNSLIQQLNDKYQNLSNEMKQKASSDSVNQQQQSKKYQYLENEVKQKISSNNANQEQQNKELKSLISQQSKTIEELQKKIEKYEEESKALKQELDAKTAKQSGDIDQIFSQMKDMKTKQENESRNLQSFIDQRIKVKAEKNVKIPFLKNNEFNGIINFLKQHSLDIFSEITVASSSLYQGDEKYSPRNAICYQDTDVEFCTIDEANSWICFDFKNLQVALADYTIRSYNVGPNNPHPKSWVIEGSNDNDKWATLDEQKGCSFLNGKNLVYTFNLKSATSQSYRFIRMRQTDKNWYNSQHLIFNCIEFYGQLMNK
ncbi:hypothetical protein M9Y10_005767 [Tritrichomonas musculus]|uniref:F5/8 type C domain-containing protein n=1 Tax=Tritrichomonas musculus TaxID=1915356 RepID=A0ABR2JDL3_9EUKA